MSTNNSTNRYNLRLRPSMVRNTGRVRPGDIGRDHTRIKSPNMSDSDDKAGTRRSQEQGLGMSNTQVSLTNEVTATAPAQERETALHQEEETTHFSGNGDNATTSVSLVSSSELMDCHQIA
ncbi:hypothetical protein H0H87_000398 [Tephrocybe sp. NHM501043]|nr:hypothetical protein H0H87_000398 [Tephrocybe sp. NHM501043]